MNLELATVPVVCSDPDEEDFGCGELYHFLPALIESREEKWQQKILVGFFCYLLFRCDLREQRMNEAGYIYQHIRVLATVSGESGDQEEQHVVFWDRFQGEVMAMD